MNNNKKYEMDMCSGPILGKMLMFVLPPGAFITLGFLVAIINKIRG